MAKLTRLAVAILFSAFSTVALGQDAKTRWEEHSDLVQSRQIVDPLGTDFFGEAVNYYSGGLSFSHTDTSVPGNNALPVAVTRTYSVTSSADKHGRDLPFADWDLDLPNIGGVYAASTGWVRQTMGQYGGYGPNRCSPTQAGNEYQQMAPPVVYFGGVHFDPTDYWNGLQINLPGSGSEEMLLNTTSTVDEPTVGANGNWHWITPGLNYIACLTTIQNGDGQGFFAIAPDGTTYQFDWMAAFYAPKSKRYTCDLYTCDPSDLVRKRYRLYATQVKDRFGNWVNYTYSNGSGEPVRLTQIQSSDGRSISFSYNAQGYVSSVSENGRSWSYSYAQVNGKWTLAGVTQPDGSQWTISFGNLSTLSMGAFAV